jgi:hypothetical protein
MSRWIDSPFAMNGAELNIQEALAALDRVLRDGQIESKTRAAIEATCAELRRATS